MPTRFTHSAGVAGVISGVLWLLGLAAFQLPEVLSNPDAGRADPDAFVLNGETVSFLLATTLLLAAGCLMVVTMVGLMQRHGGLGTPATIGIVITGLGVASLLFSWAFGLWLSLFAAGNLLFALPVFRRDVVPRLWTAVWGSGMAIGAIVWHVVRWFEIGSTDSWGNYPIGDSGGVYLGVAIMAIGLIAIGYWLRKEEPVDIEPSEPLAAA